MTFCVQTQRLMKTAIEVSGLVNAILWEKMQHCEDIYEKAGVSFRERERAVSQKACCGLAALGEKQLGLLPIFSQSCLWCMFNDPLTSQRTV